MKVLVLFAICYSSFLCALPSGGQVIRGEATLISSADALQIHAYGKAILEWDQFNIASHEAIHFIQSQNGQAILNRVSLGPVSEIFGTLQANCPIYLINPQGVLIGSNACIDTAGFLASTADLSNEAFWQGSQMAFQHFGTGSIVNLGKIEACNGDVVLIARTIDNLGRIEAPNGAAILATHEVMLHPDTKQCIFIRVDETFQEDGEIQNGGTIRALTAELKTHSPYKKAIRHTGSIEALAAVERNGRIYLVAEKGGTVVDGSLIAESGEIHVLGQTVSLEERAEIDVSGAEGGTILIGGDALGVNREVLRSQKTDVCKGAEIRADGFEADGGRVIVWSDGETNFEGHLSASSLGSSGNGGFAEISGLAGLRVDDHPDLSSQHGADGMLLLDPGSVLIQDGPNTAPPASLDVFNDAWIADQLTTMGSVSILTANSTNGAAQTLTINATVNITWATANSLTLTAARNVVINAGAIISCTDAGALTITGQGSIAGATYVGLSFAGGTLSTTSGALTLAGTGGTVGAANAGISMTGGTVSTTSGPLMLTGNGGLASNGISNPGGTVTTSAGGPLTMTGTAGAGGTGVGISLTGGTVSTTNNGAISLTGNGAGTGAGSNGLTISTSVTAGGTGTLTINGTASAAAASSSGISVTAGTVSTSSGLMTLIGQGGGTGDTNRGISYTGGSITSVDGGITMNATGSSGGGASNIGFDSTPTLSVTGAGNLNITAIGSTNTSSSDGLGINRVTTDEIVTNTGSITINATGSENSLGDNNVGASIRVNAPAISFTPIISTGGGDISITALGAGTGGSNNIGFVFENTSGVINSTQIQTEGNITIQATGVTTGTGTGNIGLNLVFGALITSVVSPMARSDVTVTAIGNVNGNGNNARGISAGQLCRITSSQNLQVTAIGTSTGSGSGHIGLLSSNQVFTTLETRNNGTLTLDARGGANSIGDGNIGVSIRPNASGDIPMILSSGGGDISITALGATTGGSNNVGLILENINGASNNLLTIETSGSVTIQATSVTNGTGSNNIGLNLLRGAVIRSTGPAPNSVTILAASSGNGTGNQGFNISSNVSRITSSGGNITVTGIGGSLSSGNNNQGIRIANNIGITSTGGAISLTGTGGFASNGIDHTNGTISTTGTGTITCTGSGGAGSGGYGFFTSGMNALIETVNGAISLTGNGGGTGVNAEGLGVFSGARIRSTGAGGVTLNGIASTTGGLSSRGIVVNGVNSTVSTNSGNIVVNGTGGNAGAGNSGLEVSSSGKITSTSGSITGACLGGTGTSGCTGIFVTGSGSLISTGTGSGINLTGIGQGTTTSNQGISLASAGAITTTSNAPITLTGTGSVSGTSSNAGIFMTGAFTGVSTVTGAVQMMGTAGGGTADGITINDGAAVSTSTTGNIGANAAGGISLLAGASGSSFLSTATGNINIAATGDVNLTGGPASGPNALVRCTTQGAITVNAVNLNVQGGSSAGQSGLTTQSGDINVSCTQNCQYAAPTALALGVMQTFGSNLTVTAGGSINLTGFTIYSTPAPTGNLLLIAGQDLSIDGTSQVSAFGTVASSLTFVVDNAFPTSPLIGLGQFILETGGIVSAGAGTPVRIYTARRSQNTIDDSINGMVFTPGPFDIDSATEQWSIYYSSGLYGGAAFTIYYKEPQLSPPLPPANVAANLTSLNNLLPILKSLRIPFTFPNYHFQLCNKTRRSKICAPTFSPYGSFIFEDNVYWIGTDFTTTTQAL